MLTSLLLCALFGYLLGSLPFAVIASRAFGLADPRSYGSKNPGATNVLRSGHKLAALITLLGDASKGAIAVVLAARLPESTPTLVATAGLFAFLGHLYPLFLGFKGGKGVATAAGTLLALHPLVGSLALLTWIAVARISRYSSLAALSAAFIAPIAGLWTWGSEIRTFAVLLMSLMLTFRHRSNIQRLISGSEPRLKNQKNKPAAGDSPP